MLGNKLITSVLLIVLVEGRSPLCGEPSAEIRSVGDRTVSIELCAGVGDRILESSPDAVDWTGPGLRVPSARALTFSFPKPGKGGFYRLRTLPGLVELSETVPSIGGLELKELTGTSEISAGYSFRPDGTGYNFTIYSDPLIADSFWDINWTVLELQAGVVTVRLDYRDGYRDLMNLQFQADGAISGFLTWDEGLGGVAESVSLALEPSPAPAETGGAPSSLALTAWDLALFGGADHPVIFGDDASATGPNLLTGAPGGWTYSYVKTGSNTATLNVRDDQGSFTRMYLSFFSSGDEAEFFVSSATVPSLFGTNDSFGSFRRRHDR